MTAAADSLFADALARWSAGYTQYVAHATRLSAAAQPLRQALLERVARGEISAEDLERALADVLQTSGAETTARMRDLQARFIIRLVRVAVDPAAADGDGGSKLDSAQPLAWLAHLTADAMAAQARALHAFEALAAGADSPQSALARAGVGPQLGRLSTLYFDLMRDMLDVTGRCEEAFLRRALAHSDGTGMVFTGRLGETVSAVCTLSSTRADRITVSCRMGEIRRPDGIGPAFTPVCTITPEQVTLDPDRESELHVRLPLDPARFDPGARYTGVLRAIGPDDLVLDVPVTVITAPPRGDDDPSIAAGGGH